MSNNFIKHPLRRGLLTKEEEQEDEAAHNVAGKAVK